MAYQQKRKIAIRRLKRDLIELQRENILSIAAHPLDDNIFEWHVNIQPSDGVYSGIYFHLIMEFPDDYPTKPPTVTICTPIAHPNVFGSSICLSMLRPHTSNVPYEGWSGAYSATSILMQLQSFLFAEKIDQDYGGQAKARLSDQDVSRSIQTCKKFVCITCRHSHNSPWPKVKGPPEALIKVYPTDPDSEHVIVRGSSCQTTHTYWVGAYGEFGCKYGKIFYEAYISWIGDEWTPTNIRGGLSRFGFGTEHAFVCGRCPESFGYDGTGNYSYDNRFTPFSEWFTKGDTITVAVDFDNGRIYFGKNGRILEPDHDIWIPNYLRGKVLYPLLSFKNSRAEFNFGRPKKPIKWLDDMGFCSLEYAMKHDTKSQKGNKNDRKKKEVKVDWDDHRVIDELWVWIFEALQVSELFSAKFVCKKWHKLLANFNCMERNEIYCYHTKAKLGQAKGGEILGIGLHIRPKPDGHGVDFGSQMDILSLHAWLNGCKTGVWGEPMTHFLPLAMNKKHSEIADDAIHSYLDKIRIEYKRIKDEQHERKHANKPNYQPRDKKKYMNELDKIIDGDKNLQLVDTLVTMMNQIVCQFVMGNENADPRTVSMVMCEKVVLGYCALHHLLLYLAHVHKTVVNNFANRKVSHFINDEGGSHKSESRDLGKLLIYLMISTQYSWKDVASAYVIESFTRRVRWMIKQEQYRKYDTTNYVDGRLKDTYISSKTGRRLVMFQVWFMKNNASETLKGYNQRLGRPRKEVKKGIVAKTKFILTTKSWWDYFDELDVIIKDENAIDLLLRFAVYNSERNGYHYNKYRQNYNNYGYNNRGRGGYNNRGGYRSNGRGGYNNYNKTSQSQPAIIQYMRPPRISVKGVKSSDIEPKKYIPENASFGIKSSRGRGGSRSTFKGWGNQNNDNLRGNSWNQNQNQNRNRNGNGNRGRGRGRSNNGNGARPYQKRPSQVQAQGQVRGFTARGPPQTNNNNNQYRNQYQYQAQQRPQYQYNQTQRQQPVMRQVPNQMQPQYQPHPVVPPQMYQQQQTQPQRVIPQQTQNVWNNNIVNRNNNTNLIQRQPRPQVQQQQIQQGQQMQPQQVSTVQYQNIAPQMQSIVNTNIGQNQNQNQNQQYRVTPTVQNSANVNNGQRQQLQTGQVTVSVSRGAIQNQYQRGPMPVKRRPPIPQTQMHMIQRQVIQTQQAPKIQNIPLCEYNLTPQGCALGQSCQYRH